MKIVGPAVLDAFGGRLINTHPALLPAFPGAHAVRDALAAGATVTGATVHVVDAGVDTGPVLAQREVAVLPGDDEARLHERIKDVERELLVQTVARAGHRRPDEEEPPMSDRTPIRRALLGVYDKTGIEELAAGLAAAGVELVSTGATARRIADAGIPVTPGRAGHRLPRVPRRPGEDAAPRRPRGDPGRPAQARARRASSRSSASPRSTWSW